MPNRPTRYSTSCRRGRRLVLAILLVLGVCAAWHVDAAEVEAQFRNLAYVYPRGLPCHVRLDVSGANSVELDVSGWVAQSAEVENGQARFEINTLLLRPGDCRVTDLIGDKRAEATVSVVERTTQP